LGHKKKGHILPPNPSPATKSQIMSKIKRGQGIGALLSSIDTELQENPQEVVNTLSSTVAEIPLTQIEVNPFQPRVTFDQEALRELSESIRVHGLIQPITLRRLENEKYQLISGERRMRASIMAGLQAVPAYVRVANDQEMLEMALVENIQRQDLNAIEIALTYKRLLEECSLTHEGLSDRVAKNRSTVTNYLRLLKLPPGIQLGIKDGTITMGHARALVTVDDVAVQLLLFNQILQQGLSVRQVEQLVQQHLQPKKEAERPSFPTLGTEHRAVQEKLAAQLGAKVSLKCDKNGKGQIVIPFANHFDLNRLLDLLEK
jgi:ParB family chromosome partitioning protein